MGPCLTNLTNSRIIYEKLLRYSWATVRARALTDSLMSLISLSMSSMNVMTKSISLCLYMLSVWVLVTKKLMSYPCTGLRLRMTKLSARCVRKRMKRLARMSSTSSDFLRATLILKELMEPSINTLSFLFLLMVRGFNNSSLLVFNSTSGLLCLSTICEPKFSKHMAACMVARTQAKYGLLAIDYRVNINIQGWNCSITNSVVIYVEFVNNNYNYQYNIFD
jgi:hypothetical protein